MMVSTPPTQLAYGCVTGTPFTCDRAQGEQGAIDRCQTCGFPLPLAPSTQIKGKQDTYEIISLISIRGLGRVYRTVTQPDGRIFILKEYVLPQSVFTATDIQKRKEAFLNNAGLQIADGRVQDFRLLSPFTAISSRDPAQERLFLVYEGEIASTPSLKTRLNQGGRLSPTQAKRILIQILQSLECLHTQKFKWPSGQLFQGLSHGNIGLETLLLSESNGDNGVVYLCDFAMWEQFMRPPLHKSIELSPQQDLVDLGYLGFDVLAPSPSPESKIVRLDPSNMENWPSVQPEFREILLTLMGLSDRTFKSSSEALQALVALPQEIELETGAIAPVSPETTSPLWKRIITRWWLLLLCLGLVLTGTILTLIVLSQVKSQRTRQPLTICCIKDVVGIPAGQPRFIAEKDGSWDYIYQSPNLLQRDTSLKSILVYQQPLISPWIYDPLSSADNVIKNINSETADFAITGQQDHLTSNIATQKVAFDGIVIFVAFNYSRRNNGLPHALNGVISLEQLRQLYTGEVTNWQQLDGPDLPVKLYIPEENEAIRRFEQKVLKDDNSIKKFRALLKQEKPSEQTQSFARAQTRRRLKSVIEQRPTTQLLRTIIRDFEASKNPIGSIGFDSLSKVFGQCSVYPLAIKESNQTAISPLLTLDQKPITPEIDLCNAKGSYQKNQTVFRDGSYPLSYPIVVAYPLDNRRPKVGQAFAEILKTDEAQKLLSKAGLVPMRSLSVPSKKN